MRTVLPLITALLLCYSCQMGQSTETPALSDETLVRIMIDIHLAQAATNNLAGYQRDSTVLAYYEQIMAMQHTTMDAYEQSMRAVAKDPTHLKRILDAAEQAFLAKTKQ